MKRVTDAIWYLDGHNATINEASRKHKRGDIVLVPERFEKFSGYQNWQKWKKKPKVEMKECDQYAKGLISAIENNSISWPRDHTLLMQEDWNEQ